MIKCVGNMWWNPKLPLDMRSAASRPTGGESALASLARDMAASQAGSRCASQLSSQLAAETQCSCACLLFSCQCHAACQCSLPAEQIHLLTLGVPRCKALCECTWTAMLQALKLGFKYA